MGKASNDNEPGGGQPSSKSSCPICSDPTDYQYRPFCSKRCADIDLGRWMRGTYVIAADPGGEEAESIPSFEKHEDEEY